MEIENKRKYYSTGFVYECACPNCKNEIDPIKYNMSNYAYRRFYKGKYLYFCGYEHCNEFENVMHIKKFRTLCGRKTK